MAAPGLTPRAPAQAVNSSAQREKMILPGTVMDNFPGFCCAGHIFISRALKIIQRHGCDLTQILTMPE